jgi:SAM-dependent methyltransferase
VFEVSRMRADASFGRPVWAPEPIDIDRPSVARMYDYFLGGSHNFQCDREAADKVIAAIPDVADGCRANRAFLDRAVGHLAARGINQFLDIGSGIPTVGNVHEVARRAAPDARIVYVDIDPVAVAHARHLLADDDQVSVIREDLRRPQSILRHPDVVGFLDLDRPVGLLLFGVLHFIPDSEGPADILAAFRDALAPGSCLAVSHGTAESRPREARDAQTVYRDAASPLTMRDHVDVADLFAGFTLQDPGVVWVSQWRPDPSAQPEPHPEHHAMLGGVGYLT